MKSRFLLLHEYSHDDFFTLSCHITLYFSHLHLHKKTYSFFVFTTYLFNIFNIEVRVWGPSKPIGFLVGPIFTKIIQDTHENQVICMLSNNGIIMMSQRFARLKQDDSRLANLDFDILVPD